MNGWQIGNFLSMDPKTARYFKGVAMSDERKLPYHNQTPALYIVNTDTFASGGRHWCAVFYYKDVAEFFDPYGMPPSAYGLTRLLATRRFRKLVYNKCCVQNITSVVCGHHCLFFAFHRARGLKMNNILKLFYVSDTVKNDKMVQAYIEAFSSVYKMQRVK